MPDSNKEKRDLANGILGIIGGIGSLADLAYPGVGTGIRMASTGVGAVVAYSLPDEASAAPTDLKPAQLEGLLIQDEADPHVYHIVGGRKHWITSPEIMTKRYGSSLLNGRWVGVHYVTAQVVSQFADGPPETETEIPRPPPAKTPEPPRERTPEPIDEDVASPLPRVRDRARAFDAPTFGRTREEE